MANLQISPLLFLRPGSRSTLAGRPIEGRFSLGEVELLSFFAEPSTFANGIAAGFGQGDIERAVKNGWLVTCDESKLSEGSTWEIYNLQRAAFLMFNGMNDSHDPSGAVFRTPLEKNSDDLADSFSLLLNRRTERFFVEDPVPLSVLEAVVADLQTAIGANNWLSFRFLVQGVEGLKQAVYKPSQQRGKLDVAVEHYARKDLLECAHGQWWLNGGGFCCFFVVSLKELQSNHQLNPSNYFEMIVLLGAAGQALVNSVYRHGLGTWMTPAVSESMSAKILGLNTDEQEALYFFKVGTPQRANDDDTKNERRTPI